MTTAGHACELEGWTIADPDEVTVDGTTRAKLGFGCSQEGLNGVG